MKRFFGVIVVLALWLSSCNQAADLGPETLVQQALRVGNARQLSDYFDTNIELIIDSEGVDFASVRADHAELILRSFFRKYPPRFFQYVYQGTTGRQHYQTGTYQTGRERFQVYVLMRETAGADPSGVGSPLYRISTLQLRKAN